MNKSKGFSLCALAVFATLLYGCATAPPAKTSAAFPQRFQKIVLFTLDSEIDPAVSGLDETGTQEMTDLISQRLHAAARQSAPGRVGDLLALPAGAAEPSKSAEIPIPLAPYVSAARAARADGAIAGRIFLLRPGQAGYVGDPAQLGIEAFFIDVDKEKVIGQARYYEVQESYSEGKRLGAVFSSVSRLGRTYDINELIEIGVQTILNSVTVTR